MLRVYLRFVDELFLQKSKEKHKIFNDDDDNQKVIFFSTKTSTHRKASRDKLFHSMSSCLFRLINLE